MYFGVRAADYAVVGTRLDEFDMPSDNSVAEVRSRYAGGGGVSVGNGLERLLLSAALADGNLLLSSDVNADSQLLLHRQIQERVSHVAPFLRLDGDPYQVVLNGRLVWIQDAYTWTNRYPDATLQGGANYLRNSVKVTVDDYDGSMRFYVVQPDDPMLQVWMKLYPEHLHAAGPGATWTDGALPLSGGPAQRPGRAAGDLSHDRSADLLQPRRPVEHCPGNVRRSRAADAGVLHDAAFAR